MIFTGIDRRFPGKSSQISVYKSSMEGFPKPEDNSGIFMAIDSSKSVGYHHAIYCSGNMPYQLMMSKIMGTARPMSKQEIFQSHKRVGNYESCFKYLQLRNTEINADIAVKVEDLILPRHSIIFTSGIIVRALVWYQGEMQVIQQCDKNKPAWFLLTNLSESNDHLAWALGRYNEIVGKNVMLLKKSELPMKLNPKKLSNNNSNSEDPHYKIKQLVKGSRSTKRVSGVLVEKSECFKYHSKSLGSRLKNRLSPSKNVDYD
ncbi:BgTH12-07470 [Blumeria graminis f. sp. triticale]|uniref:BgTH12-07470 n=1 Tax=Blumeria graminis f. sp. triticale TaxID=1689686 RepID=A0A9W4CWV5_BLUGR|nr:BgTH12-07470 [Blumeria graminis f. sp. triticale]